MPELEIMKEMLDQAKSPEDIFGALAGAPDDRKRDLHKRYQQLARVCHPDANPADPILARVVFEKLTSQRDRAEEKIDRGTYGDRDASTPVASCYVPSTLVVGKREIRLTALLGQGTFADIHEVDSGDPGRSVLCKIARRPADNDLLEREFKALAQLWQPSANPNQEAFLSKQRLYVPYPIQTFLIKGLDGSRNRANLVGVPSGRCFTTKQLVEERFRGPIDQKHVWWIFRRLLLTVWMAHLRSMVHGAVTPDHVLIYPDEHGLVLLDWCFSTRVGEYVPAYDPEWAKKGRVAGEITRKLAVGQATDIFMAAQVACYMATGGRDQAITSIVDGPIGAALTQCIDPVPSRRPQDAEVFHNDFGQLLGKREYAEMVVP